jgi:hypothetical protein
MNHAVVLYNWSCLAIVVAMLGASFTFARKTRLARPANRWFVTSCVVGGGAELFNLYTRTSWGAYLFWLVGPFVVAAAIAEIGSLRHTAAPE